MYLLLTVTPVPTQGMTEFLTNASSFFDLFIDGATAIAGLFTVWPINLFLGASILLLGAGLFAKFKKH